MCINGLEENGTVYLSVPQSSPGGESSGGSGFPRQVPAVERGDGHSARGSGCTHHPGNVILRNVY